MLPKPYYQESGITIYHADCREILPHLPKVDLVLTDPPYGVRLGKHGGANDKRARELRRSGYGVYEDTPENYTAVVVPVIEACFEFVPRMAVFGCAPKIWELPAPSALGGVWIPAANGHSPWGFQNLAPILFYGFAPDLNKGAKNTVFKATGRSDTECGHPCPKPMPWVKWLVSLASKEGETILDPFMGSGTTLRAAKDLGRQAIGIEIEEKYCQIAVERLRQEFVYLFVVSPKDAKKYQLKSNVVKKEALCEH